eukprot:1369136-Rhodomonas_salina.2
MQHLQGAVGTASDFGFSKEEQTIVGVCFRCDNSAMRQQSRRGEQEGRGRERERDDNHDPTKRGQHRTAQEKVEKRRRTRAYENEKRRGRNFPPFSPDLRCRCEVSLQASAAQLPTSNSPCFKFMIFARVVTPPEQNCHQSW